MSVRETPALPKLAAILVAVVLLLPGALAASEAPAVRRQVLTNGMRVVVRENRGADVVAVSLQVPGGSRYETAETAGLTNLLVRTMVRGTEARPGKVFTEAADAIGGTLDAAAESEYAEVRGRALGQHWERLLDLVADAVLAPALAPDELEKERRVVLAQIETRAEGPFFATLDLLVGSLYGPDAGAHAPLGLRAAVERFTRDELLALHRRTFTPDRMVIAISGNVAAGPVIKRVERVFAKARVALATPVAALPVPAGLARREIAAKRL